MREVKRAQTSDWHYLAEAQNASSFEMDMVSAAEIVRALGAGRLEAYVLWVDGERRACVAVRRSDGEDGAMLCAFYRTGPAGGLTRDATELLAAVSVEIAKGGITRACLCIGRANPKFARLRRFYARLGFEPDLLRLSREVR